VPRQHRTNGVVMVRRFGHIPLVVVAVLLLGGAGPVLARSEATTPPAPKVVVIVGPAGAATPYYRRLADETAAAAAALTPNVVRVYSPDATWERVKAELQGASVVVYLGHGNGWPSIYHKALFPSTEDGFGLNPHAGAADAHQYFGEDRIAAEIHLAPNALVVFSHLCYASGNTEPGLAEGTLDQAQQRVDNYAAGFFKAGAGAVIADAYLSPSYYVTSVLKGRSTVESIWRRAPNRNNHFLTFASVRSTGAIAAMDPDQVDSGFHRSLVVRPGLTSLRVLGGAARRPADVEPALEPSLIDLGVTFGEPDLTTPPTAGSTTRFELPMAPEAIALLPSKLMIGTRWDRLDGGGAAPAGSAAGGSDGGASRAGAPVSGSDGGSTTPATAGTTAPSGSATDADPGTTAPAASPIPDLVVPEVAGELVAPVAARHLKGGGLSVPVRVPRTPGLYRLVATLHESDGLAYDAATQALIPALVVRVTGPQTATYSVAPTAAATAGQPVNLAVSVANLGGTAWGHAAVTPKIGEAEMQPAARAILIASWVSLGSANSVASGIGGATVLPAAMAPGSTATVQVSLTAPAKAGDYLVVLDVVDPTSGSLAALGVPPGIVRVTVR
jgi:hypothetical protein